MLGTASLQVALPITLTMFQSCALACSINPSILLLTSKRMATCIFGANFFTAGGAAVIVFGLMSSLLIVSAATIEPVTNSRVAAGLIKKCIEWVLKGDAALFHFAHERFK